MFTLHTRLALLGLPLEPTKQRTAYTGDILLSSDLCRGGDTYRSTYSMFLPRPTVIPYYLDLPDYPPSYHMVERWQRVAPFTFTLEELNLAESWHGGMYTMLYALSSTGNLTPSKLPPRWYENTADRYYSLFNELRAELITILLNHPDHPDTQILADFTDRVGFYLECIQPRTTDN